MNNHFEQEIFKIKVLCVDYVGADLTGNVILKITRRLIQRSISGINNHEFNENQ